MGLLDVITGMGWFDLTTCIIAIIIIVLFNGDSGSDK